MKAALGWARVIFLVCLIGVSHDISLCHLASCSKHKGKGSGAGLDERQVGGGTGGPAGAPTGTRLTGMLPMLCCRVAPGCPRGPPTQAPEQVQ